MDARTIEQHAKALDIGARQAGAKMPDALEIDHSSAEASALFRALAHRHGEPIAAAAPALTRIFLLRAPSAPGLRFAGGLARAATLACCEPDRPGTFNDTLSVGGGGASIEDALASCIGEAVERLSQFKRAADVTTVATFNDVSGRLLPGVRKRAARLRDIAGFDTFATFDWIEGRSGITQEKCLLPADWCLRSSADRPLQLPGTALSTGVAAGPTFNAAALRAILELIERDAVGLWWIGGRRARTPTVDAASVGEAHLVLGSLRQGNQDRVTWILDLTTDLGVPVMAAVSARPDGYGFACGFGARLCGRDAVRAALYELCQMELGLTIAEAKEVMQSAKALSDADREKLALARELDTKTCALLQPAGAAAVTGAIGAGTIGAGAIGLGHELGHAGEALPALLQHLAGREIEVALVDLTRSEFGIPVVAAVAPDLQLMPSQLMTRRLKNAIAQTGGGARYTNGLSLF